MTTHAFLPHTPADRAAMLATCGLPDADALFADIPLDVKRSTGDSRWGALPLHGLDELSLEAVFTELANQNTAANMACFMGGGAYQRYVPAVVNHIASRSEFYTAYTPYQPEIAQGTLQVIYEFQSMIAELTGLPVANASVYDAANAVTEAVLMALRITKRSEVLLMQGVHPHATQAMATYIAPLGVSHQTVSSVTGALTPQTACVVVQQPNYYGLLCDVPALAAACKANGSLLIVSADPVSLGVLPAPGAMGADIVVGDLQPLGNHLAFGGPYAGYMACQSAYLRQLPGRLASKTVDGSGQTAYCLTLQAREQHIRRQKATSNICTNQALNVLKATVMLTLLGPQGLAEMATLSVQRLHRLVKGLCDLPGVSVWQPDNLPFFSEAVVTFPTPVEPLLRELENQHILGGIPLDAASHPAIPTNSLLITATEMAPDVAIDRYLKTVSVWLAQHKEGLSHAA
jgi:glycine dehydrogenase subunit 1